MGLRLGIDASNIRAGGGLIHLAELLAALDPTGHGIERVKVWSGRKTLQHLPERPWLALVHQADLDGSALRRSTWRRKDLDGLLRAECDILFAPGGIYRGHFRPFVTMSQNLLPFDHAERARFGISSARMRYHLLERLQAASFRQADGVIFLTEVALRDTLAAVGPLDGETRVVPHGIAPRFFHEPRPARSIEKCTFERPLRILYVSIVNLYKHQWHVAEAVCRLRKEGLPVQLDLVGRAYPPALRKLQRTLATLDPQADCIRYRGAIPYEQLETTYAQAEVFAFASSCETFGMIVLEAMAAGLPIACSRRGAMTDVLADAGRYFNPEDPDDILEALRALVTNPALRTRLAREAHERARQFTWGKCADDTFSFITRFAKQEQQPTRSSV